ncbi:MAG: alanine--glyoxylate aminotransferase [SAR324 cluster bacterium]|uniref:Alanine--glyoxylate aminotransferase n=1 Tax=SAR324 cluster bacterium TaxID=2024889 RepID=A0A2A4TAC8_9DELT|nr:MAG: alanine--glyoxylate aminotransferase [SAR324 cluster bacterium]
MKTTVLPPTTTPLSHLLPSDPLLLMGAGPVPIPQAVAQANSVVINHLGGLMDSVIDRVKEMARYAFQTHSDKVLGVAGSSSAAMEMGISNLLWPGRRALILQNGTFSNRFGDMAIAVGAEVIRVEAAEAHPITPEMVRDAFKQQAYDVVTMVQGETSCGVLLNQMPEIIQICKENGCLVIVDAVCTLSTMPLKMDEWQIDVAITGGQKGISSIPGVSMIAFSSDAWKVVEGRTALMPHWCLDAKNAQNFWGDHQYHYTAPVPGILAMHEALRLICEETLEKRFERHEICSLALQEGIERMGLGLFVNPEYRLNSVVAIDLPQGVDGGRVRKIMADRFNVEISGAFGLNIIRIGQMGEQCRSHNLFKTLYAMGMAFQQEGVAVSVSEGMAALQSRLAEDPLQFVS